MHAPINARLVVGSAVLGSLIAASMGFPLQAGAELTKCQNAVIKAAAAFVQAETKAWQKCEQSRITKGTGVGPCPNPETNATLAKVVAKLVGTDDKPGAIAKACCGADESCGTADDDLPAALAWPPHCPNFANGPCTGSIATATDVATCLRCIGEAAVTQAMTLTYDSLNLPPGKPITKEEKALTKCQTTIGKASATFLITKSKALQKCWATVHKTGSGQCPDEETQATIDAAAAKKAAAIRKACCGKDRSCGTGDPGDFLPAQIGFTAMCPTLGPTGPQPACGGPVATLDELLQCVDCVTTFDVDCVDRAAVPAFAAYPAACNAAEPTATPTPVGSTPTATPSVSPPSTPSHSPSPSPPGSPSPSPTSSPASSPSPSPTPNLCINGVQDGTETDVDCGGGTCAPCVDGRVCSTADDCWSGTCAAGHCGAPVSTLTADVGPDRTVEALRSITLDGSHSRSPVGPITSWAWTQTSGPAVILSEAATATPHFTAPAVTGGIITLGFQLVVGDGVDTAQASLKVYVRKPAGVALTTSQGLIRRALAEGVLDRETAMQYLAFAVFGDPRLPAEYTGVEAERSGSGAMHQVVEWFATLSPAAQEVLRPFLLPPNSPNSWWALRQPQATSGSRRNPGTLSIAPSPGATWKNVIGGNIVIWYQDDLANGPAIASDLRTVIETEIWPEHLKIWQADHMPWLDDSKVPAPQFNGVRGKLNIYIVRGLADYGSETAYFAATPSPSYIQLREGLPLRGKSPAGLAESVAHEMTHSCQDSFKQTETYSAARWLYESLATWAEDRIYPDQNTEQEYATQLLDFPQLSLDDDSGTHPYGAYLFFQGMTRGGIEKDDFIRRMWLNFEAEPALAAVNHAFSDFASFHDHWGGFMVAAWNRDPATSYWGIDGLAHGAKATTPNPVPVVLDASETAFEMDAEVDYLSAKYNYFTFPDATARSIYFYDGLTLNLIEFLVDEGTVLMQDPFTPPDSGRLEKARTTVIAKQGDSWNPIYGYAPGGLIACQDDPTYRFDELVAAFGDSEPTKGDSLAPLGHKPRLWASNIGCYEWQGTVTATTSPSHEGPAETMTATVTFERDADITAAGGLTFRVKTVNVVWQVDGTYQNCTYSGSLAWSDSGLTAGQLAFAPQFISGAMYRAYTADSAEQVVPYTAVCTTPDGSSTTEGTWNVHWLNMDKLGDPNWHPKVSDDGLTAANTVDDGRFVYTWSFTARTAP